MNKLSIIIPAYNEAKTIHLILDKVKAVQLLNDIEKELASLGLRLDLKTLEQIMRGEG